MNLLLKLTLGLLAVALLVLAVFLTVVWGLNVLAMRDDWSPV